MQNVKHAVIACAGYGSRLGLNIPKCMIKVNERTLLSYLLELTRDIEDVRVIVGFEEDLVIEEVRRYNPNAVIVRNPNYRTTSIAYSYHLATKDLCEPFLILDGDLAIHKQDFLDFLASINPSESLIAVSKAQSEDTVFAKIENSNVTGISSSNISPYEWTSLAYLSGIKIEPTMRYAYNAITAALPIRAKEIRCFDVDTSEDHAKMLHNFDSLGYSEEK